MRTERALNTQNHPRVTVSRMRTRVGLEWPGQEWDKSGTKVGQEWDRGWAHMLENGGVPCGNKQEVI